MKEEILRLTKFWMDYISQDHHKDRDCHWYINETWSYGESSKYTVEHNGYIAHDLEIRECNSYEEAQKILIEMIRDAIIEEKKWAKRVLEKPENWDESQIKRAELVSKFPLSKLSK